MAKKTKVTEPAETPAAPPPEEKKVEQTPSVPVAPAKVPEQKKYWQKQPLM